VCPAVRDAGQHCQAVDRRVARAPEQRRWNPCTRPRRNEPSDYIMSYTRDNDPLAPRPNLCGTRGVAIDAVSRLPEDGLGDPRQNTWPRYRPSSRSDVGSPSGGRCTRRPDSPCGTQLGTSMGCHDSIRRKLSVTLVKPRPAGRRALRSGTEIASAGLMEDRRPLSCSTTVPSPPSCFSIELYPTATLLSISSRSTPVRRSRFISRSSAFVVLSMLSPDALN